jgi:hypothetical protein
MASGPIESTFAIPISSHIFAHRGKIGPAARTKVLP